MHRQDNDEQTSAAAASARDRSSAGAPTVADSRHRGAECRLPMGELAGKRSARSLLPIVHAQHGKLMLHGEASLARDAGVDGVHLPAGRDAAAARALMGSEKILGVSIHTVTEAEQIDPARVDYALAGPAFETPSKPGYGPEIGRKGLADIAHACRVPVLAIGGINAARIGEVLAGGTAGVAVMGGVMRAANPAQEMRSLLASLNGALAIRS
jgi:thiamine-phosphate pyrophosphorylase